MRITKLLNDQGLGWGRGGGKRKAEWERELLGAEAVREVGRGGMGMEGSKVDGLLQQNCFLIQKGGQRYAAECLAELANSVFYKCKLHLHTNGVRV